MLNKYFRMAFEALALNKVRSFLTTLGMVIGVFSVIVMIGLGQASQAYITNQVKGLGAGVLIVTPGNPKTQRMGPPGVNTAKTLTMDDALSLENVAGVKYVTPSIFSQVMLSFERNNVSASVLGTSPNIVEASGFRMKLGRFFTLQEAKVGTSVIVLGAKLAKELFKNSFQEPLGSKVKIGNQRYKILGVLDEQGSGMVTSSDDRAFMPANTFQRTLKAGKGLNSILIKVESEEFMSQIQERTMTILRYRHGIREDEEDDFKTQTQAELLETVSMITRVFTFLLAGIAAISLIVGGIGIMNIMLVSVTERTREIGVRKAVGAKRKDILIQFLIESASISVFGGTLGIIFGLLASRLITQAINLPFVFSGEAVIGAFLFSAGVGVFFGMYPANKASKLHPVDALRYE